MRVPSDQHRSLQHTRSQLSLLPCQLQPNKCCLGTGLLPGKSPKSHQVPKMPCLTGNSTHRVLPDGTSLGPHAELQVHHAPCPTWGICAGTPNHPRTRTGTDMHFVSPFLPKATFRGWIFVQGQTAARLSPRTRILPPQLPAPSCPQAPHFQPPSVGSPRTSAGDGPQVLQVQPQQPGVLPLQCSAAHGGSIPVSGTRPTALFWGRG